MGRQWGGTLRKLSIAERSGSARSHPPSKRVELDRLTCFAFLLGWQALANQGSFGIEHVVANPTWWLTNVTLVLLLLRPSSLALLTAALTLNVVSSWMDLPYRVNHLLFEDVVNLTILTAIAVVWLRHRNSAFDSRERRAEVFALFAPAVRLSVVLLYFFVTLAKLNADFFDPLVSCAAVMFGDIAPFDVTNPPLSWTATAAVYGSLLAEGGIPLLLLFRKTRTLGIVAGLGFHLLLAFHPHGGVFGFSSLMFAMLFLFTGEGLPATASSLLDRVRRGLRDRHERRRYAAWLVGGTCALAVAATTISRERLPFFLWLPSGLALVAFFLIVLARTPAAGRRFHGPFFARPILLYAFPLLILLNCASPYVGLKTETSLTMFSNLRTEGGTTNHLFIPTSWQVVGFQEDLVEITASDRPEFRRIADDGYLLTRFEFERMLRDLDDFRVYCECYGTTLHITKEDGVISGFDQQASFSPWLGRLLLFREVSASGAASCTH